MAKRKSGRRPKPKTQPAPPSEAAAIPPGDSAAPGEPRLLNRELSWLEFNQRVLDEALNNGNPLLSRLMFLAITASNLDEFFMVRVGGLLQLSEQHPDRTDPAGMTPAEQLKSIADRTHQMAVSQYRCLLEELEPSLAVHGIRRLRLDELTERMAEFLKRIFDEEIYPVLSPLAVPDADEFPLLPNHTLNALVRLEPLPEDQERPRFAVINLGRSLGRFITVPGEGGYEYVMLEDVVRLFVDRFFPGETIIECVPFRIVRNADMSVQEDLASDLLSQMEEVLDARKQSQCVRLEISDQVTSRSLEYLCSRLELSQNLVYALPGPIDLSAFMQLTGLQGYDNLRFESWTPRSSPLVDPSTSLFDVLSREDVLLYHPFESFDPVVHLLEEASRDPDVLAIKQILYRTSRNSPIVAALRRAAESGKSVTVVVELKARFDEARNIEWAKDLERAGVQVFYGVKGLKTHAKLCVVVRREPQGIQKYVHFGTGNYNEATARLYTDASLMTSNHELGADATSFFHAITGYSKPPQFLHIEMAPIGLRDRVLEMIRVETERANNGHVGRIMAKLNALVDPRIIEALYEASAAGVRIDLNIRGICCLRPGVPGLSDNIRVISIVDRLLEHSRIMYFYHGGDERVYISSADWMPRNLDRRIELMVPVDDAASKRRLISILELCMNDTVKGRKLLGDGTYIPPADSEDGERLHCQHELYSAALRAEQQAEQTRHISFEPHRAPGHQMD